jgi:hypothetical protein
MLDILHSTRSATFAISTIYISKFGKCNQMFCVHVCCVCIAVDSAHERAAVVCSDASSTTGVVTCLSGYMITAEHVAL